MILAATVLSCLKSCELHQEEIDRVDSRGADFWAVAVRVIPQEIGSRRHQHSANQQGTENGVFAT